MSTDADTVDFAPSYIAGLFDTIGRVRFDMSETEEGMYTVRPMLRIQPYETELRAAVIGEFLEAQGYQYEYIERGYGDKFFRLQQRSDLEDLQSFLSGESAHLVQELAFVTGTFADEFDFEILEPLEIYRFALLRDELRYGWRPKGRYHTAPEDIAEEHDINTEDVQIPDLSSAESRSDYSVEWIAGVYDGACRYRPSINESKEYKIGYGMYPVARLHRSGVSQTFASLFLSFCDDYNLSYGNSSEQNKLQIVFTGSPNIRRVLDVIFPRLLVLGEVSEVLVHSILPRFDENTHHTKQGFYELLRDFDKVAEASGGPFRHREYDPAYFTDIWREQLELVETEVGTPKPESTRLENLDEFSDITLSAGDFTNEPGRYRTILDRVKRDAEPVTELKSLYDNRCQLCGARLASGDGTGYSEVHHLNPLGSPHNGPDDVSNMLVLCPNHHADFDNGVVRVALDDLSIEHPYDSKVDGTHLSVESEHKLSYDSLQYHNEKLCHLR